MISTLRAFFSHKHALLYIFLAIVCLELGMYLFLYNRAYWITPPNRVRTIENVDAYYPDVIRQGMLGAWAHTYSLSTLPTPKIYTYAFFIMAGKVAGILNIDPVAMYEITRITGGIGVFFATYWLITLLLPRSLRLLAVAFTMAYEVSPSWESIVSVPVSQWIPVLPAQALIARHFGLSHHTWAEMYGILLLCFVILAIKNTSWFTPLAIIACALFGMLANPTFFLILLTCVFPIWLLYSYKTGTISKTITPIGLASITIIIAGLFTKSQFTVGLPWSAVIPAEKSWWSTEFILVPFIQSFTIYYPFVLLLFITLPFGWKYWSQYMRKVFFITFFWSILPVGLILISVIPWIPLVNGRIASDLSAIPIGLLSTLSLYGVSKIQMGKRIFKYIFYLMASVLLMSSALLTVRYMFYTIEEQNVSVSDKGNSFTLYPTRELWEGMMALKKVPQWSHIMTLPRFGDIIIAYAPVRVYQGQPHDGDINWLVERGVSHRFYTGEMPEKEVLTLFEQQNISFVVVGPEEKYPRATEQFYPDLLEVFFENSEITIYRVRDF